MEKNKNIPVLKDLSEIMIFANKLREKSKGELAQAQIIIEEQKGRFTYKGLWKIELTEGGGWSLQLLEDLREKQYYHLL